MGKGQHKNGNATDDILVRGSGKKFKKKGENGGKTKKVLSIIGFVLAVVLVLGTVISYSIFSSGIMQRKIVAAQTENYTVTSSMMTYFFNSTYQNFAKQSASYLEYMGLDTSKPLEGQDYADGSTWHDQILASAKTQVNEILVLCEAARAAGMSLTDEDLAHIEEDLKGIETYAANSKVTADYYVKAVYGSSVTMNDLRECMKLTSLASKYQTGIVDKYSYSEADFVKYFDENTESFLKFDYLSYTFEAADKEADNEETTATETAETTAAEGATTEPAVERTYAEQLAAVTTSGEFTDYIRNYLTNVKYAGMDAAALEEDDIDIDALVEKCLTEGSAATATTDFAKWAKEEGRMPYQIFTDLNDETGKYTVYMILPTRYPSDLDYTCLYRDAYQLKDYRYIFVDVTEYDDMAGAKSAADQIYSEFEANKTEENFAALASEDKYGDGKYEGGLIENADYKALASEVDAFVYNTERAAGDSTIVEVAEKGYYIVYFSGTGSIKWQLNADNALKNEKYSSDLKDLSAQYKVTYKTKGLGLVKSVTLGSNS